MTAVTNNASSRPPLEDPTTQIRLLRIDYDGIASFDDPIRCTLSVRNIGDVAGKYVAISYCWGPPYPEQQIFVGERPCTIRYNCWYALWQMRLHNPGTLYWLDSLCIDQDCHREKQQQVGQMGSIFAGAKLVAACLGPRGDDHMFFPENSIRRTSRHEHDQGPAALKFFLGRPYFRRLWIVQECFLARKLDAFCGRSRISWEELGTRIFHPRNRLSTSSPADKHTPYEKKILKFFQDCDTRQTDLDAKRPDLCDVVILYATRECHDPRDKIYGLLALATPAVRPYIHVDYEKPLLQVMLEYISACKAVCLASMRLEQSIRLLIREFSSAQFDRAWIQSREEYGLTKFRLINERVPPPRRIGEKLHESESELSMHPERLKNMDREQYEDLGVLDIWREEITVHDVPKNDEIDQYHYAARSVIAAAMKEYCEHGSQPEEKAGEADLDPREEDTQLDIISSTASAKDLDELVRSWLSGIDDAKCTQPWPPQIANEVIARTAGT